MPASTTTPTYQLTEAEKAQIAERLANQITTGTLIVPLSDADKTDIKQEILAELKAGSQDTSTLIKVADLTGVTSIPAVKNDTDIVAVPLSLLTTNQPIEVAGQEAIDILVAQGKIVDSQIYFTPVDEE